MKQTVTNSGVGKWVTRMYDAEKAAGTLKFVDDLEFGPSLLYAKAVRSAVPHGEIISIDKAEALKVSGVKEVIVGEDFPYRFGLYLKDRSPMAIKKVRYIGEPVALVVAESEEAAEEGALKVSVKYKELEAVFDPVKAATDNSVLVHPELGSYEHVDFITPQPGTNIANWFRVRRGDIDKAFKEADYIFEEAVTYPQIAHGFLEPHCCVCVQDPVSQEITIWTAGQSVFTTRDIIADALGLPLSKIRVIAPPIGGGFGGKAGMTIEALCLAAATHPNLKGRPIKLFISREEVMLSSWVRQGYVARIRMAVNKEGKILGIKNTFYFDTGISAEYGANPVRSAGYTSTGCYYIPNVWTDSYAVYTNKPFGGAYRGFGMPEFMSALEMAMDIVAHKMGMDPVEFRLKNLLKPGLPTCTGMPMHNHALETIVKKVAEGISINKEEPAKHNGWKRGKGIALAIKAPAMPADAASSATVEILGDGSVKVLAASMDMGQGVYTSFAQIASEELGIPIEKIKCYYPDTQSHPYDWQTVASRSCWSMGMALKLACEDARNQLIQLYSEYWQCDQSEITIEHGVVKCRKLGKAEPIDTKIQNGFKMPDGKYKGGPIIGRGHFVPPDVIYPDIETGQSPKSVVHFTVGAVGVDLEVDPHTGEIVVNKVVCGYDLGKAISPLNVRGQIEGGTVQGISAGIMEGMYYDDKGLLLTPSFTDYKIATIKDIPDEIQYFWEETPEEISPYGNRGVGEHSMISPAPAIGNALFNALKVRIHSYPFTRERVYKAIKQFDEKGNVDFWEYPFAREQDYKQAIKSWD